MEVCMASTTQPITVERQDKQEKVVCDEIKRAYEFLAEEGFRPSYEEDDTVKFRVEGVTARLDRLDAGYRIYIWVLGELPEEQRPVSYWTANYINLTQPFVRACVTEDNSLIVSYSMMGSDISQFLETLIDSVNRLLFAGRKANQLFNDQLKPKPLNS
jgi:hypothetical protein